MKKNEYMITKVIAGEVPCQTEITVKGWVRTRRDSKAGFSFIMLSDGSCFQPLQIVAPNTLENYSNEILHLTTGCAIIATGELVQSVGSGQTFEIKANKIEIVGMIENPETYPMSAKHHTLEYLREYPHLRSRTNIIGAVTRIQNCVAQAIHRFFNENGFYWIHTPIITTNDCEGAGQLMRVTTLDLTNVPIQSSGEVDFSQDFFARETFLTVSGQLNVEAYCEALSKVYTFGPTFRAENSNTPRHMAEFWMVEPEVAFANLIDIAKLAEQLIKYTCEIVLTERQDDMSFFADRIDKECITRIEKLINDDFQMIDYTEAIKLLENSNKKFEYPVFWGMDLQSEHERFLTEELIKKPVAVINYPKDIKAFYMRMNDDEKTVAAMDILAPGIGEIIGGSQREERLEKLQQRINQMGINSGPLEWYLDLRRYGSVPHAGFGLGFERYVSYITGVANLRDIIPFPRTAKHAQM